MANSALEIVALILSLIGLIGTSATTGLPMWKVTAFIQENIIVFETRWEGLWMNCYRQANIRMQCKVYDSLLYLPPDLQAARGLMCCSVALAGVGLLISIMGLQRTVCIRNNDRAKRLILILSGSLIIGACFCCLIPVCWTANVIIRDFYNPLLIDAQRRELGEALYIGWVSAGFLLAGGCIFCCCNIKEKERPYEYQYSKQSHSEYMAYPPQPQYLPQYQRQPQHLQPRGATSYSYPSSYHYPSRHPSARSEVAFL